MLNFCAENIFQWNSSSSYWLTSGYIWDSQISSELSLALYEFSSSQLRKRLSLSIRNSLLPTSAGIYLPWTALTNSIYIISDETWHLCYTHASYFYRSCNFLFIWEGQWAFKLFFLLSASHYALNQLLNVFRLLSCNYLYGHPNLILKKKSWYKQG